MIGSSRPASALPDASSLSEHPACHTPHISHSYLVSVQHCAAKRDKLSQVLPLRFLMRPAVGGGGGSGLTPGGACIAESSVPLPHGFQERRPAILAKGQHRLAVAHWLPAPPIRRIVK